MPPSLDALYEAALLAIEARDRSRLRTTRSSPPSLQSLQTRQKQPGKLKPPCPADRLVTTPEGPKCATRKLVGTIKLGPWKGALDARKDVVRTGVLKGIRGTDLPKLARELKDNRQHQKDCDTLNAPTRGQTFSGPGSALQALFKANPALPEAIRRAWGSTIDEAYREWLRRGMTGSRPTLQSVYGSASPANLPQLDFMTGFTDRLGRKRKIYSMTEALYASVPATRRWDDWMPVLRALQEEVNRHADEDSFVPRWHEIQIPGRAGKVLDQRRDLTGLCKTHEPRRTSEIIAEYKAKKSPAREPGDDEDAPF
jgi:hypothetical protein